MVTALSVSDPAVSSIPVVRQKDKRLQCLKMLTEPFPKSDAEIARQVGCDRSSVGRYRKELLEKGVEFAMVDGRKNSGRRVVYEKAYVRLEELKKQFPRSGGRDLWVYLTDTEGWSVEDVPSIGRIDSWLSCQKLTHPVKRVEKNTGFWLTDKVETFLDRVGMDEKFPFYTANGRRWKLCDLRDCHTGIVYGEPFAWDYQAQDQRGMDSLSFAQVYLKFVEHCGVPRHLVLDNGPGQVIQDGWLPEIARYAIEKGSILEWEPYGTPTQNAHVERWHREIEKRWLNVRSTIYRMEEAQAWCRREHWKECAVYPRWNLSRRPPASLFPVRSWGFSNEDCPLPDVQRIGKAGLSRDGIVRMHRRVETGGLTQLHGEEYIRLSDGLVGGKVRIDFCVRPGGEHGEGNVIAAHGEIVATFKHRVDCGCKRDERLVYDVKTYGYAGGEDCRVKNFSQDMYDEKMEKAHKNKRSKGFMQELEAVKREQIVDISPVS